MFGNNVYFSSILKLVGDKKFTLNILALSEKYVLSIKFLYVMVCIFFDMTSNVLFLFFISTLSSRFIRISLNISLLSLSRQFTIHLNSSSRLNMLCENGLNDFRVNNRRNLCSSFPLTHREKVTPYFCLCHFRCPLRLFQTLITFISPYPFTVCKFNHHFIYTTFFYF